MCFVSPIHRRDDLISYDHTDHNAYKLAEKIAQEWQEILQFLGVLDDTSYLISDFFLGRLVTYLQRDNGLTLSVSSLLHMENLPCEPDLSQTIFNAHFRQLRQKQKNDCDLFKNEYDKQNSNSFFTALNLSYKRLVFLPTNIQNFTALSTLNLSKNFLKDFNKIGELVNLRELSLSCNQLEEFPQEVTNLVNLEKLYLSTNKLAELPGIEKLTKLRRLSLSDNKFKQLPEGIGELNKLYRLSLSNNKLEQLPEEIGELSKLKELLFKNNPLTTLPQSITELSIRILSMDKTNINVEDLDQSIINWLHEIEKLIWKGTLPPIIPISHMLQENSLEQPNESNPTSSNLPGQIPPPPCNDARDGTCNIDLQNVEGPVYDSLPTTNLHRTHSQMESGEISLKEPLQKKRKVGDDDIEILWLRSNTNKRGDVSDMKGLDSDYTFDSIYGFTPDCYLNLPPTTDLGSNRGS